MPTMDENYEGIKAQPNERPRLAEDVLAYRYWFNHGVGVAIVAVKGGIQDWAVYIGGLPSGVKVDAINAVSERAEKLSYAEGWALLRKQLPDWCTEANYRA